ncbi:hypothetical protein KAN5_27830 [Pseudoalteromonas sp. KAN5]|nr:hypothetical protein KAN5_27830 [Pseudoalteromonas sp. KAN5]
MFKAGYIILGNPFNVKEGEINFSQKLVLDYQTARRVMDLGTKVNDFEIDFYLRWFVVKIHLSIQSLCFER